MNYRQSLLLILLLCLAKTALFPQICCSERDALSKRIEILVDEKKSANKQLQKARDDLNKCLTNGSGPDLQAEIEKHKREIRRLNGVITKLNADIRRLKERIAALEKENAGLKTGLEAEGVTIVKLTDTLFRERKIRDTLAQEKKECDEEVGRLNVSLDNCRDTVIQITKRIDTLVTLITLSSAKLYAEYKPPFCRRAYYLPLDHKDMEKAIRIDQGDVHAKRLKKAKIKAKHITRLILVAETFSSEPGQHIDAELTIVNLSKQMKQKEPNRQTFPIQLDNEPSMNAPPHHYFYCRQPINLENSKGKKNVITRNAIYECSLEGPRLIPVKFKFTLD